jgi:hypothetical protein
MSNGMRDLTVEELDMVTGGIVEFAIGPAKFQFGGQPNDDRWSFWNGGYVDGGGEDSNPQHEPEHVPG